MHDYDVALKLLLQTSGKATMRAVFGATVEKWLDVELPQVQNPRMDLLGETADGGLVHLELQSGNEAAMALRMAEYHLRVYRLYGKFPRQVVLYVGEAPLRMPSELRGPDVWFRYRLIDARELDGDRLLESEDVGDNVIAILARLRDQKEAVSRIVGRIAGLAAAERAIAMQQLLILAGLRHLARTVEEEAHKMPIEIDLRENEVIGREIRKAEQASLQEGLQEGLQKGLQKGLQEGELLILRRQIEKRFGPMPSWAVERLAMRTAPELEELADRVLDAPSLEDLLQ